MKRERRRCRRRGGVGVGEDRGGEDGGGADGGGADGGDGSSALVEQAISAATQDAATELQCRFRPQPSLLISLVLRENRQLGASRSRREMGHPAA